MNQPNWKAIAGAVATVIGVVGTAISGTQLIGAESLSAANHWVEYAVGVASVVTAGGGAWLVATRNRA